MDTCPPNLGTISEEVFAAEPPTDRHTKLVCRARRALHRAMGVGGMGRTIPFPKLG